MSAQSETNAVEVNKIPTPAPTPTAYPGPHATDSQNVRHYDAEDIKSHGLDPATHKKKGKTAPNAARRSDVSQMSPVNDFRIICSSLPTQDVRHPNPNFFVPNCGMMYHLIGAMNDQVCALRPYSDRGSINNWIPQISNIVFGVLFYIQVLRAKQLANRITHEQFNLLNMFINSFPLETIEIPGPLVPFFRSISVSAPGFANFEDVFPDIPMLQANEETLYKMIFLPNGPNSQFDGIAMMLPHIPLMMEQFTHLINYLLADTAQIPRKYSTYEQLRKIFNVSAPAPASPLLPHFNVLRSSVGFWHRPNASNGLMERFAKYIVNYGSYFPTTWTYNPEHAPVAANPNADPPVAAAAAQWHHPTSIFDFLGMRNGTYWFSTFLKGMHTFNKHWKGNVSLLKLHPSTSTAGMILFKQVECRDIVAHTVFGDNSLNKATRYLAYNSSAETTCPYVVNEDFQDAQVAQLNISCPTPFNGMTIGQQDVTLFGDFWRVYPAVMTTDRGELTQALQSMIVTPSYFTD